MRSSRFPAFLAGLFLTLQLATANPLSAIGETFADWKNRLFGRDKVAVVEAPARGPVVLQPGQPQRLRIGAQAPSREFARGSSRYRMVELPTPLAHAAVRVQVITTPNPDGRGNAAFKPLLYVMDADGKLRDPLEVKPLHIDIRPFRRTRLLGCVTVDDVSRFAVSTTPAVLGKSYESESREAVKAPTRGGYYYATDPIKVRLPWIDTGVLILKVTAEEKSGAGC
ncbi:hypothetical protein [Dokdonella sp.]|uniref:hypothetical protein n=1 Tax=Dokdonella sp. TaxID=2291710 RepID=UPI0031BC844B|nr:hypothetical protein [Dokdonella sp.]